MDRYLLESMSTYSHPVPRLLGDRAGVSFRGHRLVREGVLVVIELILESIEVEAVPDVLLIDFAEKLVVFQVAEPTYPPVTLLGTIRFRVRHRHRDYY